MKAVDSKISSFIGNSDRVFIIPPFQRNYAWSINQCEELFSDIVDAYYKNNSHYIGNIVYYEGANNSASFNEFILIPSDSKNFLFPTIAFSPLIVPVIPLPICILKSLTSVKSLLL